MASLISDVDEFGFRRSEEEIKFLQANATIYFTKLSKNSAEWASFNASYRNSPLLRNFTMKRLIRKGIPLSMRKQIWLKTSGSSKLIEQHPNLYRDLFRNEEDIDRALKESIKIDLPRTFPDNIYFEKYKVSLYNVLIAFANHNPVVGYCQGLNYIAGLLLIVTSGDEEATFFLLKHLIEYVAPEYHTKTMKFLKRDIEVITDLIKLRLPLINEKVNELGLPWIVIMTKWLICLFVDVLPIETTLRIFDCLFNEGYKIIFRASLAIVINLKDEIMKIQDINDLAELFRSAEKNRKFLDCHQFINSIFAIKLKKKEIAVLRRSH